MTSTTCAHSFFSSALRRRLAFLAAGSESESDCESGGAKRPEGQRRERRLRPTTGRGTHGKRQRQQVVEAANGQLVACRVLRRECPALLLRLEQELDLLAHVALGRCAVGGGRCGGSGSSGGPTDALVGRPPEKGSDDSLLLLARLALLVVLGAAGRLGRSPRRLERACGPALEAGRTRPPALLVLVLVLIVFVDARLARDARRDEHAVEAAGEERHVGAPAADERLYCARRARGRQGRDRGRRWRRRLGLQRAVEARAEMGQPGL